MNEWEKGQAGYLYDPNNDEEIINSRNQTAELCFELNMTNPTQTDKQAEIIKKIIKNIKGNFEIVTPFYCDYGFNITLGNNFYSNHNLCILDGAPVTFGDNVFIAPNCIFSTAGHPIDTEQRNQGLEIALPITVGDNVWFGANVAVLPGITIGSNVVIGAGSVVNKDIPDNVVAAGNPCKVIRNITEEDKNKYPIFKE